MAGFPSLRKKHRSLKPRVPECGCTPISHLANCMLYWLLYASIVRLRTFKSSAVSGNMHASRIKHCCLAAARLHQLLWTPHLHMPTCLASYRSASMQSHNAETAYNSQPGQRVEQVPVPMCRRPAQHTEQLSVLMQWRQHVLDEISKVRDEFVAADGGPSTSDLQVAYPT
jgi:hypothetical protein